MSYPISQSNQSMPQYQSQSPDWDKNPVLDFRNRSDIPNASASQPAQTIIQEAERQAKYTSLPIGAVVGGLAGFILGSAISDPKGDEKALSRTVAIGSSVGAIAGGAIGYFVGPELAKSSAKSHIAHAELGIMNPKAIRSANQSAFSDNLTNYMIADTIASGIARRK